MGMLGNSTWGLPPLEKHLLYRACVLPIAMYSFRLWFFEGAKNKTAFKILTQMQCKACSLPSTTLNHHIQWIQQKSGGNPPDIYWILINSIQNN